MKTLLAFALAAMSVMIASDTRAQDASAAAIPIVVDTDIGSDIDDTWALAHVLQSPELDLKMVLCATGDTAYRCRVAAKFLETAGRSDVPVALGPTGLPSHEYQRPWVEGYDLDDYAGRVHRDGIDAFIDLVHAAETPITLIAIGPVTNVAEALRRDSSIASSIHLVAMAGSIDRGYGPEPVAEANVRGDVEAFRTVLQADWLSLKITPLDTAGRVILAGDNYQRLKQAESPMLQALFENYRIWADRVTWMDVDFYDERSSTLFDVVAVYMAYADEHLRYETVPIHVTEDGRTVRAAHRGVPTETAMHWVDLERFYDHVTEQLLGDTSEHDAQRD